MSELEAFYQPGRLTVFVDIADPDSHLAMPGTLLLLQQSERSAQWYPFIKSTPKPPTQKTANETRGAAHRRLRGEYRERELRFYASALGLPLRRLYEQANALPFANALLWLGASDPNAPCAPAFVLACFSSYWAASLQIDDCSSLAELLTESGADGKLWLRSATVDGCLTHDQLARTEAQLSAAQAAGVFNAPAYLYDGEIFYGRAHLPLLLRRLEPSDG
ncbi:MAG: DsbA family protein [Pseudomonadales bacterium]